MGGVCSVAGPSIAKPADSVFGFRLSKIGIIFSAWEKRTGCVLHVFFGAAKLFSHEKGQKERETLAFYFFLRGEVGSSVLISPTGSSSQEVFSTLRKLNLWDLVHVC